MLEFNDLATFGLLVGLELVLGIDNILLISILTNRLPEEQRQKARYMGLGLALALRLVCLMGVAALQKLTTPIVATLTGKDLVLLIGGLFLIYKAVKEMHHAIEHPGAASGKDGAPVVMASFSAVITQIVLLDLVFSIDSVITAVGLTDRLIVIYAAVIVSFVAVLLLANTIAAFVNNHPALKVLALAFLVCIGITLFLEAMHFHIPKGYIYLPMGFALVVELLQMRQSYRTKQAP